MIKRENRIVFRNFQWFIMDEEKLQEDIFRLCSAAGDTFVSIRRK